jgi:hypothetical protein
MEILMRISIISILILSFVPAAHAQDGWQTYVSEELGIVFDAPPGVVMEIGSTPRGDIVGTKEQPEFVVEENGIEYRVGIANFAVAPMLGETILGEALFLFQGEKPVLLDAFSVKGEGRDTVYGRVSTVELAQGGQATAAFFFTDAKLYQITRTVRAAPVTYDAPNPMRFFESVSFDISDAGPGATELEVPAY